ncbi:Prenyltransferase and squalene oxidase repeat protein [Roseimaritima multifibrata]|uniref:Prenyltransferase and squalene oxidase repeat protein n=1 Tax=Roseimaritima multifibrata TaxID=1930274 RepID=A0A517MMS4_9BACT|nr:prenyltransferase/squalene oxidase repeat-containing protein [Roseimaritima multifibrata]QDS96186.1 Prenyltransferase and squalene oxidase repeat protein [Roseimaritima multifibrata]
MDHPSQDSRARMEAMWPIDVALMALGGLVIYVAATRLGFDDSRWLYNAWTYVAIVTCLFFISAFLLRQITGRLFQRSVEIGFLVAIFLHLLLLIVAVNVVIFSQYWPDTFTGTQPERSPVRKTVPEHLFQRQSENTKQPDWAKPVDVQTASRVVPEESREIPPMEKTSVKLEMPTEQPKTEHELRKQMIERQEAAERMPSPRSDPGKLARREAERVPDPKITVDAPEVAPAKQVSENVQQRQDVRVNRSQASAASLTMPTPEPLARPTAPKREVQRKDSDAMPQLAMAATEQPRPREARTPKVTPPAGAAPSVPTVSVARLSPEATRQLSPESSATSRSAAANMPSLAEIGATGPALSKSDSRSAAATGAIGQPVPQSGMPQVSSGVASQTAGRSRISRSNSPNLPVGPPNMSAIAAAAADAAQQGQADDAPQMAVGNGMARRELDSPSSALAAAASGAPNPLDIRAPMGPAGLGDRLAERVGLGANPDLPDSAAIDLGREPMRRREVGGPIKPAGSQVASVESFQRRVMRTSGAAAPAPAGMVGPETEEAIELGLEYLAKLQNKDGSWSLQQPGEKILLHSDTAATGLCLLAFQGAGYTHRKHQYAGTVAKGLNFLRESQRDDGDLFRPEDSVSNRNVWMYSHAIASLALCEAYGMTQDPQLMLPAQKSLNFIVDSQHPTRGGWRYQPRNSSDTSVSGWMMMALKSGELSGLQVPDQTYEGIEKWLQAAQQGVGQADRYRYNPYAGLNASQRHGRTPTRTMTAVGMLMRMYGGWRRDHPSMVSGANYLAQSPPAIGTPEVPRRDTYYWYYATQVMFHMGGEHWQKWNQALSPTLVDSQVKAGDRVGSWEPFGDVPDRWSPHAGRLYLTAMNLLSLEVFYRHLPIYEETAN